MQRNTFRSGSFHNCPLGRSYVSENLVEENYIGSLHISDYNVEEWNSHYNPDTLGDLCGPTNSSKFAPQGRRDSVFYCGLVTDGADSLFSEEDGKKIVTSDE
jgi:hypothetical protein